jgi:hypothetical protein
MTDPGISHLSILVYQSPPIPDRLIAARSATA